MSSDRFYAPTAEDFEGIFTEDFGGEVPRLAGDYYSQRDDAVRGVTLSLGALINFQGCDLAKVHPAPLNCLCEDFDERHVPPRLSDEVKAFLGSTVLHVVDSSPVAAGNRLLAFLNREVAAHVDKVNATKFTLRATICQDGLWCEVKIRIYQMDQGSLVELQRYSGDSIAFHRLYRQASEYLLGTSASGTTWSPPETSQMLALSSDRDITPLLDMAHSFREDVELLAEVASALSGMAADPVVADQLRKPCACAVLQLLRQVEDFRVAFPLSQMLAAI